MNSFQLDGETIVKVLSQRKTDGTLSAEISPQTMFEMVKIKEPGRVVIVFQKGDVIACMLSTGSGRLVTKDQERLSQLLLLAGVLHWQLELASANKQLTEPLQAVRPALPAVRPTFADLVPYRLREVQVDQIQDLMLRRVYQLVDGQRSIEKLSVLIRIPPDTLVLALQQLHQWGLIAFYQR